jgi:hypothetical protein
MVEIEVGEEIFELSSEELDVCCLLYDQEQLQLEGSPDGQPMATDADSLMMVIEYSAPPLTETQRQHFRDALERLFEADIVDRHKSSGGQWEYVLTRIGSDLVEAKQRQDVGDTD